jgi:regulation of enolase protein 1 (concanavalin A-like superfamily)
MDKMINLKKLQWTQKPKYFVQKSDRIMIETEPHTDLPPYGRGAEAKDLIVTPGGSFHMTVRCDFTYHEPFDQCGLVLYNGEERKAIIGTQKRDGEVSKLQCIVYYDGGGDRCERDIGSAIRWMYYRIWYRTGGVRIQYSFNGIRYSDFREFAVEEDTELHIGIYACSPSDSYFDCEFSEVAIAQEEKQK